MGIKSRNFTLALLASSAALTFAVPALAQDEASQTTDSVDIIVTAQKRAQNVQDVPAAITALTGAVLADRGLTSAQDLQTLVPNMQAGRLLGQTAVTIRGIGLNQGSPGVAIHVDGVYQPRPSMGDLAQIDLERVEVLRGPQGTLYGRNATGGAINFVTRKPGKVLSGYTLASAATYGEWRVQGMVNLPLGDAVRTRLVADRWGREHGFVKNVTPGKGDVDKGESFAVRSRTAIDLTPNLTADIGITYLAASGPTSYFTLHNTPTPTAQGLNPYLVGVTVPLSPWRTAANDPVTSRRRFFSASGTLTWDLGAAQVKSITAFQHLRDHEDRDDDSIALSAFPSQRWADAKSFTQEVNVSGKLGPLEAVIGGFYMHDKAYDRLAYDFKLGIFPLPPGSILDYQSLNLLTRSQALFGDVTVHLNDKLRLIGGLRYSEDRISQEQQAFLSFGPTPPFASCPLQTNTLNFHSTTPRAGVQFDVSNRNNLYATYSKGFKAGGWNLYSCANDFRPEQVTSYELGSKNRLLDGKLTANFSAFYYDYTDLQLSQVVGLVRLIRNAAAARIKGLEAEFSWRGAPHWEVTANGSLLDAKYTSFNSIDSLDPALGVQNVSGKRLSNAPAFSTNVGIAYTSDPVLVGGSLTARADVSFRSRVFFREFNNPLDSQSPYAIVNLGLTWASGSDRYRVRIFANNVFNQAAIVQMDSSDNFGSRYVSWNAPSQFGVEMRVNF